MRTMTESGTLATKEETWSKVRAGPVGLLGEQTMTATVSGVMAPRMASRSWLASGSSPTGTGCPPTAVTAIG